MKLSKLFGKTTKEISDEAESANHRLLIQGGFVDQLMAGVYTYLPLGYRVLKKVENIVREEMVLAGGQEILMPALQPAENWKQTGRWEMMDDLFRFTSYYTKKEFALGPTHEEVLSPLAKKFNSSYKDFPYAVFQIQTKFRDEKRAKSGILRGREFLMKDYYSFHSDEEDLDKYYEKMEKVYDKVFDRLGIGKETYYTYASGGTFAKYSHEYQTVTSAGEDMIYICDKCKIAINKEIITDLKNACPKCGNKDLREETAIEVGNIFKIKDKFTKPFDYRFISKDGKEKPVLMGCYGLGISRLMGAIVEIYNDDRGILWPKEVAPYDIHLISLNSDEEAEKVYKGLQEEGFDVLYDDRDISAGEKFSNADLIGIPIRLVASKKTLAEKSVEVKERGKEKTDIVKIDRVSKELCDLLDKK
ncbi:prolyl-tRNA synthetase [bacterium (Candidatus Howlettbacteria) CG_4_10_14_0_8_um_filter_40_9]|nr:MAG: prolyl-tRNA synthetase [bacterium (Candidatus Howlettbacteria) CG_4_10_14_0_8_um_filter_40_9]